MTCKTITTKFMPVTNHRGSRIKASDGDRNSVTLSYDHALDSTENHDAAARELCRKMDWHGKLARGGHQTGYTYVFVTTSELLEV